MVAVLTFFNFSLVVFGSSLIMGLVLVIVIILPFAKFALERSSLFSFVQKLPFYQW